MGYSSNFSLVVKKQKGSKKKGKNFEEIIKGAQKEVSKKEDIETEKLNKMLDELENSLNNNGRSPNEMDKYDIINRLREDYEEAQRGLSEDGSSEEVVHWYDAEKNLLAFSKEFPNWFFELTIVGEENGDFRRIYFLDGKRQSVKGNVVYPEFDAEKLA